MRTIGALVMTLAWTILPASGQERAALARARQACGSSEIRQDRLLEVTSQGDLVLENGRLARLAAIRLPDEGPRRDEALAWLRARTGRPVAVEGPAERDRWSRLVVGLRLLDAPEADDLGRGLVAAGLGLVDPGAAEGLCHPELLALERKARELSLGVWQDDRYKPIDSDDRDRLRARFGSFVLVEGRIRSIGERSQRTYLNFGEHWSEDFTIIIPTRTWKLMRAHGLDPAALRGQRIRARGILEPWQGAALTVFIPEMIERLAGERLPR